MYCDKKQYEVVHVCSDSAITGGVFTRPALIEAFSFLQPGMILVIDRNNRMARDMLVALTIQHEVAQRGCMIEFADGSPLQTTPEGRLLQNVLSAFSQYEREKICENTKAGLARKKANGESMGRPPIGWTVDPAGGKQFILHEQEQYAISKARDMSAQGWNSEVIADLLTQSLGPCRGKPWSARTVRKILSRQ